MIEREQTSPVELHPGPAAPRPDAEIELPEYEEIDPADLEPQPFRAPDRKRVLFVIAVILILLGLALGPPLVNVSRYRREIASSISASLGRPVHLDKVSLNLLPAPSFTLENFVVSEDPAFGAEPILRANSVRATLRLSSLWRHKVEFSTITLEDPSVNLVHLPDGRWNLQSILLQASRVPVAPTAQKDTSEAPRFPYIEATGARVNLKTGLVKQPLSLTDARFALWLPEPDHWHLRLEGHPNRTDVPATDTGKFRVEAVLGRAATLEAVPVDLAADWTAAPLGGVSWVILGRDAGIRGDLALHAAVKGTFGENAIESHLELHEVRRADFVPANALNAEIACRARAREDLHRLDQIECQWPPRGTAAAMRAAPSTQPAAPGVLVSGTLPELMRPSTVNLHAVWTGVPAAALLDLARAGSQRISPALALSGTVSGDASCCGQIDPQADGEGPLSITITNARLTLGNGPPVVNQTISATAAGGHLLFEPVLLNLGAATPATLTADADWDGLHLHLAGSPVRERLLAVATALPQCGDGLQTILPDAAADNLPKSDDVLAPLRLDANATRAWPWSQQPSQSWTAAAQPKPEPPHRKPARKRR